MRALLALAVLAACGDNEVTDGEEDATLIEAPAIEELTDRWEASGNDGEGIAFEVEGSGESYTFAMAYELDGELPITGVATIETRMVDGETFDALVFTKPNGEEEVVTAFIFFDGERLELAAFPFPGGYMQFYRVSGP